MSRPTNVFTRSRVSGHGEIDSLRILHIVHDLRNVGNGIVHVAIDLAYYQRRAGHVVAIASGSGEFVELLERNDIEWFYLPQHRRPLNLALLVYRYERVLARFRPDIVHAHVVTGALLGRICRFHHRYSLFATAHRAFSSNARIFNLADKVIAVSNADAVSLGKRGISSKKLLVIHNGPLGSPRRTRAPEPAILDRPSITTVSGLYRNKGVDVLIRAFERIAHALPAAQLYIVGNGPDKDAFVAQAQSSHVPSRIHFMGFEPLPERYLSATDVFVLASRNESFGLVLIEARNAGCAIVASDVGGIPEALDGGRAGILVPPGDPAALADAIASMLLQPHLMAEYQRRARIGLDAFTAERMARQTLDAYDAFLKKQVRG